MNRILNKIKNALSSFDTTLFINRGFNKIAAAYAVNQKKRADKLALYQLVHLDDHLLRDMGIKRSDIMAVKSTTKTLEAQARNKNLMQRNSYGFPTKDRFT